MDVRVNITMPKEFLAMVDENAKLEHRNRSELIREALRTYCVRKRSDESPVFSKDSPFRAEFLIGVLKKFFAGESSVALAYFFGSQVRQKSGPLSDIDIAVLFSSDVKQAEYSHRISGLTDRLMSLLHTDLVDLTVLNEADPLLLSEVAIEGVLVFERSPSLSTELKLKAIKRQMDSAHFRRLDRLVIEKFLEARR